MMWFHVSENEKKNNCKLIFECRNFKAVTNCETGSGLQIVLRFFVYLSFSLMASQPSETEEEEKVGKSTKIKKFQGFQREKGHRLALLKINSRAKSGVNRKGKKTLKIYNALKQSIFQRFTPINCVKLESFARDDYLFLNLNKLPCIYLKHNFSNFFTDGVRI